MFRKLKTVTWQQCGLGAPYAIGNDFQILTNVVANPGLLNVWVGSGFDLLGSVSPLGIVPENEISHANSFGNQLAADRYLASRILLRLGLSWVTPNLLKPNEWVITTGEFGKPKLDHASSNIDFNISYTGEVLAVAIQTEGLVGIDIEEISKLKKAGMDVGLLTVSERKLVQTDTGFGKQEIFAKIWTAKEAATKALGHGVEFPFDEIEVAMNCEQLSVHAKSNNAFGELNLSTISIDLNNEIHCLAIAQGNV